MTGRYSVVMRNGMTVRVRDQSALREDVLAMLRAEGPMPKRRLMTSTKTTQDAIVVALAALAGDGQVEKYRAMSRRGRMDEFWCVPGQVAAIQPVRFGGAATLSAMQQAAARKATLPSR